MNPTNGSLAKALSDLKRSEDLISTTSKETREAMMRAAAKIGTGEPRPPQIDLAAAIREIKLARKENKAPPRAAIRRMTIQARDPRIELTDLEWLVATSLTAARELSMVIFSTWPSFLESDRGRSIVKMASAVPESLAFLSTKKQAFDYFSSDLVKQLAHQCGTVSGSDPIRSLANIASKTGFPPRLSEISRQVLAQLLENREQAGGSPFQNNWMSEMLSDHTAAARLLPLRFDAHIGSYVATMDASRGQTAFLSYCIKECLDKGSLRTSADHVKFQNLLLDVYKDPRLNDSNAIWRSLRSRYPETFANFTQALSVADLEFFFEQLDDKEKDPARAAFWKKYVGSIRNTKTYLKPSTASRIQKSAERTGNPQIIRAAMQAIPFQSETQTTSPTFCMYFDNVVVVEFLLKGNAVYLYDRADFESKILAGFESRPRNHIQFKKPRLVKRNRFGEELSMSHIQRGWEPYFTKELADLGIVQSVRGSL